MSNDSITFQIPGQSTSQAADTVVVASNQTQSDDASQKSDQATETERELAKPAAQDNADVLVLLNEPNQNRGGNTYGGYLSISGTKTAEPVSDSGEATSDESVPDESVASQNFSDQDALAELDAQSAKDQSNSNADYVRGILDAATSDIVTNSLGEAFKLTDRPEDSADSESTDSVDDELNTLASLDPKAINTEANEPTQSAESTEPGTDGLLADLLSSDYADNRAVFAFLNQIAEKIDECRNGNVKPNWPTGRHFVHRRTHSGMTLADKINAESALGRSLFGPIPEGHQREFFEHRKNLWIWHESWQEADGHHEITIRYTVDANGVFKTVNAGPYIKLEGDELVNFLKATNLYLDFIETQLYGVTAAA